MPSPRSRNARTFSKAVIYVFANFDANVGLVAVTSAVKRSFSEMFGDGEARRETALLLFLRERFGETVLLSNRRASKDNALIYNALSLI